MKQTIFLTLLLALLLPAPGQAQTAITTTTITEPVTSPAVGSLVLTVAATTGMAVNGTLYVDGSVYRIQSISGLLVTVTQAFRPATHLDNAKVWVVPVGAQIGLNPVGSCIRGTAGRFPAYSPYTIMFNLATGDMATCRGATLGSRRWYITNQYGYAPSDDPPVTP